MTKNIVIAAALLILAAGSTYAAGIKETVHNLSTTGPTGFALNSQNETEICVFCHTPHVGDLTAPLWNRNPPTGGGASYLHYNSATLSSQVFISRGATDVFDESLMCLACHDGSVSMYTVMNVSSSGMPLPPVTNPSGKMFAPVGNAVIGAGAAGNGSNNLSDDHPISFKYYPVWNDGTDSTALHTVAEAEAAGIVFFPRDGAEIDKRVECASCHDPHVNYVAARGGDDTLAPFLRTTNDGSAMCLACHDI